MKKKLLLCISVFLTVFFVTFSAGCIGGGTDPIVGEWEYASGPHVTFVLKSDGSGQINYAGGTAFPLTWSKVSGTENSYKITMTMYSGVGGSQTDTVKLDGDKLYNNMGRVWAVKTSSGNTASSSTSSENTPSNVDPIVGKWEEPKSKQKLEFWSDGSGQRTIYAPNAHVPPIKFTWEKVSETGNSYTVTEVAGSYTVKLEGELLNHIYDKGTASYIRI